MISIKEFAVSIAKKAGSFLKSSFNDPHHIEYKGEIDLVTDIDKRSEQMLIELIEKHYPEHDILSEETPRTSTGAKYRWIIDPLDGTTNYAHRFPVFAVSIALEKDHDIIMGTIYNPMLDELFFAEKNKGAYLNNKKIAVSTTERVSRSLLATGFPYDIRNNPNNNINYFNVLALKAQAIRRAGSAALDLAYLAAGRFDGFWELKLRPWDTAAGWLMVKEAGGSISDITGNIYSLESSSILASNGRIHEELQTILKGIDPDDKRFV